ncbi:MAG TPA: limonene-1,2-epoxide hydrolase family protein, partial [Gaiellaceae bacterium]|nr:limonene-1,2-epoxide hydrolase family protein [Gaiellaceae bacterium]
MDAEEVVAELLDRFRKGDVDGMLELFADDAVYHNIPLDPAVGVAAIREVLGGFAGMMVDLTIDVTHQLAGGALVMQERIDAFTMGDTRVSVPVCGVFEVEDGHIRQWREYFDMNT